MKAIRIHPLGTMNTRIRVNAVCWKLSWAFTSQQQLVRLREACTQRRLYNFIATDRSPGHVGKRWYHETQCLALKFTARTLPQTLPKKQSSEEIWLNKACVWLLSGADTASYTITSHTMNWHSFLGAIGKPKEVKMASSDNNSLSLSSAAAVNGLCPTALLRCCEGRESLS